MPNHITIGSDPEFALVNMEGENVPADALFYHGNGEIGCDGRNDTGEFRPHAGTSPWQHLMSIRELFARFTSNHPDHMILAGSRHFRMPLGGHIHFSGPSLRGHFEPIVRALDYHLAIPALMLENRPSARGRRRGSGYGNLGDWRGQREIHGGFEYRTLSSWLVSFKMAQCILEIAYLIAYDYKHLQDSNGDFFMSYSEELGEKFNNCNKTETFYIDGVGDSNLYNVSFMALDKLKVLPNAYQVMNSILTLESLIRLKEHWHQEINALDRWHLHDNLLQKNTKTWAGVSPVNRQFLVSSGDVHVDALINKVESLLQDQFIYQTYYIYGIATKYGKDIVCSHPLSMPRLGYEWVEFAPTHFGRAKERAPENAILIGVSRSYRHEDALEETAGILAAMIKQIEREY